MATLDEVKAQAQALVEAINSLEVTASAPVEVTLEVVPGEAPTATVDSAENK